MQKIFQINHLGYGGFQNVYIRFKENNTSLKYSIVTLSSASRGVMIHTKNKKTGINKILNNSPTLLVHL